ncbi:MAG: hypothetical protein K0Q72_3412 [Armatimonadetes bacterium]|nr:hypothetical protein [Armatimonadota bacterium]
MLRLLEHHQFTFVAVFAACFTAGVCVSRDRPVPPVATAAFRMPQFVVETDGICALHLQGNDPSIESTAAIIQSREFQKRVSQQIGAAAPGPMLTAERANPDGRIVIRAHARSTQEAVVAVNAAAVEIGRLRPHSFRHRFRHRFEEQPSIVSDGVVSSPVLFFSEQPGATAFSTPQPASDGRAAVAVWGLVALVAALGAVGLRERFDRRPSLGDGWS